MLDKIWAIEETYIPLIAAARPGDMPLAFWGTDRAGSNSENVTIAVLPLYGLILQRASWLFKIFGGTSTELFARDLRAAIADPSIKAVMLDVDSPGGSIFGIEELSNTIFQARGKKPIIAMVNPLAASAAYWIASAADQIVMTPSGQVGSIGVFAIHQDLSKRAEMEGVKHTIISAGKFKTAGNELEPLDSEAHLDIQGRVDTYYNAFVRAVARNRNIAVDAVRNGYGEGRVVGAKEALTLGMIDKISTMDDELRWIINAKRLEIAAMKKDLLRLELGLPPGNWREIERKKLAILSQ